MKDLLAGKVVLVSGGTQGLGAGIARTAAREGATLVIAGRNAEHGEQVVAELTATGAQACYVQADITDVAQAVAAVETTVSGTDGSTRWSTPPGSLPGAPCWTRPRSCSTSTSRSTSRPRSS